MADAGYHPDPVAVARHDVRRSIQIVASASDELDEHRRWFQHYVAEEKKRRRRHARRMKRQEALLRRRERRRRAVQSLRQAVLTLATGMRAGSRLLANGIAASWRYIRWMVEQARTLAHATLALIARGATSIGVKGRALALAGVAGGTAGAKWTAQTASTLAAAALRLTAAGASSIGAKSRALARGAVAASAAGADWIRRKANALTRSVSQGLALGLGRIEAKRSALAPRLRHAGANASARFGAGGRNLSVRLHRKALIAACRLRVAKRDFGLWAHARLAATTPLVQAYGQRGSALVARLPGHAAHRLDSAKLAVGEAWRWLVLSANSARSLLSEKLRRAARAAAPVTQAPGADVRTGAAAEPAIARKNQIAPRRRTAIACVEPWRCRLPAVRAPLPGRELPAPH